MKIDWTSFFQSLIPKVLSVAPKVILDVEQDKANFSHEEKTQAATEATLQTSEIASVLDSKDQETIDAATTVTNGIITALKTEPPQNKLKN
jgi:hypothetical protein